MTRLPRLDPSMSSPTKRRVLRLGLGILASFALLIGGYSVPAAHAAESSMPTFELTVISGGDGQASGHAFIMLKNISKANIKVFGFNIKIGKIMTVGTFGNKSDGKGVYLNLEAHKNYRTDRSLMIKITPQQMTSLTKWIKGHNYWSCPSNCSSFASGAWNHVAPTSKDLDAGFPNTPTSLENSIKSKTGNKANIDIPGRAKENVRRLMSDGTLKKASAKTLSGGSSGDIGHCFS